MYLVLAPKFHQSPGREQRGAPLVQSALFVQLVVVEMADYSDVSEAVTVPESEFNPSDGTESESSRESGHMSRQSGRIRVRNKMLWKRNVAKLKRAKGEEYTGVTGKVVPRRTPAKDCKCKGNCLSTLTDDEKSDFLTSFCKIANQEQQDAYLGGLITIRSVVRRRPTSGTRPPRACSFEYKVRWYAMHLVIYLYLCFDKYWIFILYYVLLG